MQAKAKTHRLKKLLLRLLEPMMQFPFQFRLLCTSIVLENSGRAEESERCNSSVYSGLVTLNSVNEEVSLLNCIL